MKCQEILTKTPILCCLVRFIASNHFRGTQKKKKKKKKKKTYIYINRLIIYPGGTGTKVMINRSHTSTRSDPFLLKSNYMARLKDTHDSYMIFT